MNPAWWWLIGPAAFLAVIAAAIFLFWLIYGDDFDDEDFDERPASRGANGYREHGQ